MHPRVTVITPAYNAERFLATTVESVRAQSFEDWELVVAEDGSSDGTRGLLQRIQREEPRLRIVELPGRSGPAGARNAALAEARGRYVAFLDSDDLWRPEKLHLQLEYMNSTGAAFVFASYGRIDERGEPLGPPVLAPPRVDYATLLRNTIIGCLTVVLDREQTGPVSMPPLRQHEDLALWYRLLKRGLVAHGLPDVLADYRHVRGSASGDKLRSALHMWQVYRRVERLPFGQATQCFAAYAWNATRKHRGA